MLEFLKLILSYMQDATSEICGELNGPPELIIGNYSDGNLVASLIAHKLGITQVCGQPYK